MPPFYDWKMKFWVSNLRVVDKLFIKFIEDKTYGENDIHLIAKRINLIEIQMLELFSFRTDIDIPYYYIKTFLKSYKSIAKETALKEIS